MKSYHNALLTKATLFVKRHDRLFVYANMIRRWPHLLTYAQARLEYRGVIAEVRRHSRAPDVRTAVVLHLFYPELWPTLRSRLETLGGTTRFDLFVTLRSGNEDFAQIVHEAFPESLAVAVPNLGRDVLPFMQIAPVIMAAGYDYVLKLHSKKSSHDPELANWFEHMVTNLVPDEPSLIAEVLRRLVDPSTGVIGPAGEYYALEVYLENNAPYLKSALRKLCGDPTAAKIIDDLRYGFFAGTMFWARLDTFQTLFRRNFPIHMYDVERGQTNGTLPHVLERLFALVPILEGRVLYEIEPGNLRRVTVATGGFPEWWGRPEARGSTGL